ncbi:MAG: hypothetical protein L0H96_24735 [Humibacillus sp.]|nr:hypothetical protein [Humibacillus sp.]MDN5780090.1 hypothetical protein [Humibacillus sp.]
MSALAVRSARISRDRGRSAPEWDITLLEQAHASADVRLVRRAGGRHEDVGADGTQGGPGREVDLAQRAVTVYVGDDGPDDGPDDGSEDRHATDTSPGTDQGCFTSVSCLGDGRVTVRSCSAPPALLVGRSGAELVPSAPCSTGSTVVDVDHRLLVLSAAAYETLPRALVILLREFPSRFLRTDPVTLLETLFADIPVGSAALISPMHPAAPVDHRNPKES